MSSEKVHFKGLHALRFFAASLVIIHHVEQYKSWKGLSSAWGNSVINGFGHASVSFFFVLSGFLITYLLLSEQKSTGHINILHFYWKRVLRIWPVYFLVVGLVVLVAPLVLSATFDSLHFSFGVVEVGLLLLFLPNLLRIRFPWLVGGNHLWSVGVEEQFYIFWPLLVRAFSKRIVPFLLLFVAVKAAFQLSLWALPYEGLRIQQLQQVLQLVPFEQMAIGGLGAAVVFLPGLRTQLLSPLTHRYARYLFFGLLVWSFTIGWHGVLASYFDAVIFLGVILNVTFTESIYRPLEHPVLRKLGDVSYGIYMYHPLVIAVALQVLSPWVSSLGWSAFNVLLFTISIVGTLLLALASYRWLEQPVLRWKKLLSKSHSLKQRVAISTSS